VEGFDRTQKWPSSQQLLLEYGTIYTELSGTCQEKSPKKSVFFYRDREYGPKSGFLGKNPASHPRRI